MADKNATKDDIKAIRKTIEEKVARNREIVDSVKGQGTEDSPLVLEEGMREEVKGNLKVIEEARETLDLLLENEEGQKVLDFLDKAPAGDPVALKEAFTGAFQDVMGLSGSESKDLATDFLNSSVFKEMKERGAKMECRYEFKGDIFRLARKDIYSDMPSGTPGSFGTVQRDPMVLRPQRAMRVRDLFPVQGTNAALIEYFRVTGFTNAASVVAQRNAGNTAFVQKPRSSLTFEGQQAAVRTIAHWEAAHRDALDDEPQLRGLIQNELLYGLRLIEDDQILNGTGTGQDLLGIRNVTGIQAYTHASPDNKADALRRAMTLVTLAYYEPTGVVLHDGDWEDIELLKDDNGQYLVAVSIAAGGEQRVWRAPVVTTPAMQEGFALVGAFGLGAQIYDRQAGNIRIAEEHADFFTANAIVVLAEERLALATKRPESFVEVDFL